MRREAASQAAPPALFSSDLLISPSFFCRVLRTVLFSTFPPLYHYFVSLSSCPCLLHLTSCHLTNPPSELMFGVRTGPAHLQHRWTFSRCLSLRLSRCRGNLSSQSDQSKRYLISRGHPLRGWRACQSGKTGLNVRGAAAFETRR